jgi:hypothetical protein|tara:strand:- start:162488 stop:162862 length:375 start_codon:yes stop_codon:yes gene_type:complete
MIIPVVTKDIMFFSKLKSSINSDRYSLEQIKNKEDILDILIKSDYPLCIIDFSSDLIELPKFKDIFKNRGLHTINTVGYYPHVNKILKQKAIDFGTKKQVTRNQLMKNINNIVDDCIYNEMSSD